AWISPRNCLRPQQSSEGRDVARLNCTLVELAKLRIMIRLPTRPRGQKRGVQQTSTATLATGNASEKLSTNSNLPQRPRATLQPLIRIERIKCHAPACPSGKQTKVANGQLRLLEGVEHIQRRGRLWSGAGSNRRPSVSGWQTIRSRLLLPAASIR